MLKTPQINLAEQVRHVWRLVLSESQKVEDLLKPDFWAHIAQRIEAHSIIEVVSEDGNEYARLFVRDAGKLFVKVSILEHKVFHESKEQDDKDSLKVKWRGPNAKFCLVQGDTVIEKGFALKEDAEKAKEKYAISNAA